jgi:hypothetical protein
VFTSTNALSRCTAASAVIWPLLLLLPLLPPLLLPLLPPLLLPPPPLLLPPPADGPAAAPP